MTIPRFLAWDEARTERLRAERLALASTIALAMNDPKSLIDIEEKQDRQKAADANTGERWW